MEILFCFVEAADRAAYCAALRSWPICAGGWFLGASAGVAFAWRVVG